MTIERVRLDAEQTALDQAAWVALWRPYWLEKRRIPSWLPLAPHRAVLSRLAD
jgi:hypothetical protein